MTELPGVYTHERRELLFRLVANGGTQGLCGVLLVEATRASVSAGFAPALGVALAALGAAFFFLRVGVARDAERLGQDYVSAVRVRLVDRCVEGAGGYGRTTRAAAELPSAEALVSGVREWVSLGVAPTIAGSVALATLLLGFLALADPALAAVAALVALPIAIGATLSAPLRRSIRGARGSSDRLTALMRECLQAGLALRYLDRDRRERRRVIGLSLAHREAEFARATISACLRSLPAALLPIGLAGAFILIERGNVPPIELAPTLVVLALASLMLRDLATAWDTRLSLDAARVRLASLLSQEGPDAPTDAVAVVGADPARVVLESVRIGSLFDGTTAGIAPGEWVWLEGASGSGKSTLVTLLAGAISPEAGRVLLDETPLDRLDGAALQRSVQWISPELPLLRGTIAENLRLGVRECDDAAASAAMLGHILVATGVGKAIEALPRGFATPVSARGANLSRGLRSSIALVRAAVLQPRLVLIDDPAFLLDAEATAALDGLRECWPTTLVCVGTPPLRRKPFDRVWRIERGRLLDTPFDAGATAERN